MQSTPAGQDPTTVAGIVANARARFLSDQAGGATYPEKAEYLEKTICTDVLLDCLNVAVREPVRKAILRGLPEFSHGNLTRAADFSAVLDEIHLALQVDAAFDDYEVELEAL